MEDHDQIPELNGDHLDRKSILRSAVPKRNGQMRELPDTNHKFHELIQYYECLDNRSSRPAKSKNTVCSSMSTTPDLAEYESGSTGSRSSATPDLLFAKPSSLISDLDSRTNSPDLGYCSKRGSRRYEDRRDGKMKKSDSPDLGYGTTPEKGPFKSYADMRYLLDLKNPSSSDSESSSIPKAHAKNKSYNYTDCLNRKIGLESDGTSASKRSSFCIEELDPEFTNLEDFTFEVTLNASISHSRQMKSLERRIGNMSSMMEQTDDTLKNKCFDEEDSDSPSSVEKDTLNYTNPFEYEAPNNLESDYARYKLAFDITESDFSANLNTSRIKRSSQSSTDGYDDFVKDSEDTTVGNSQDFEYDGILDGNLNENYAAREQSQAKLLQELASESDAKSGSSMSQYSDLKLDEYKERNDEEKSHQISEIKFPDNMFTIDFGQTKDEDLKSPDSMFSFAYEHQPGSRISNFSAGLNDKEIAEEKAHASANEETFDLSNLADQVRPDSRLSDTYYGFGLGKIAESYEPSTSPRLDYMNEPRARYSMVHERTNRGPADLNSSKRLSLDLTKPVPHYMDNQFGVCGYRYSLPKPSDFLSDSLVKRKQSLNQSLNLSSEPAFKVGSLNKSTDSEMKSSAMRNFMSSCMNETAGDVSLAESTASSIPPALPSQPPPSLDDSSHKMKIDLHTVDYIMNNRRRSCLKKDANVSKNESSMDEHNYSIVSLIGALEELGIEVEFNEPDEQHRRRTIGRNTSLMESVIEEEHEEKASLEESKSKVLKHELNEIKEADEVMETPVRLVHKPEDKMFRLERPASPVLSSSKKLKFLQRRPTEVCKANVDNMIEPQKHDMESTRKLFVDSEEPKMCKLHEMQDNSISTISMTTSASREVSPATTESPQQKVTIERDLAPVNLCKVLDAEDLKQSRNSEFEKIEKYAKASTLRTGKVDKVKRNSFSSKFPRLNRKNKETTTVESIPSVVENFLTDALGSEKDHYETTMVDDTFANTNDIDSSMFTVDESAVDLDRSLRRSISDVTSNARAHYKNPTKKNKSSRRRWSELQEEMHVLVDSVSKQQLMIQQASKALKMCYSFKEFENSEEHVESERILLLAHKRKSAAMDAINEFSQKPNKLVYDNYGNISLKNIVLPLNSSCEKYDKKNDSVEWYMVVVQNGLTVLASQPVMRQKNSNEIVLPDPFSLPKVNPDFKLTIEIYRLKLKKKGGISHELKYHIRGSYSLADAWYKAISKLTQRSNPSKQNNMRLTKMFESSFMLIGQMQLSLKDLSRSSPWALQQAHPILKGTIVMSLSCNVDLTESNTGWLTHGTDLKGYTVWNRRWCVLVGHVLKFWDYPTEDPEEKPIMQLDLIHCKHSEIGVVDREFCAKPRTIMLQFDLSDYDITDDSNIREQRNFLTLDTNRDLEEWLTKINRVLKALKSWNAK